MEEDLEKGYSPDLWRGLSELGWLGLIIPEQYGGVGMTFQDLDIVLEEMGRNIFPGPFFCTVVTGAIPILEAGTEKQKNECLKGMAHLASSNRQFPFEIQSPERELGMRT